MRRAATFWRVWVFLYTTHRRACALGAGLIIAGAYPVFVTLLSRLVIDIITGQTGGSQRRFVPPLTLGLIYGGVTIIYANLVAYIALQIPGARDQISLIADELLIARATEAPDVTEFEQPKARDALRVATIGSREISACFVQSIEVCQSIVTLTGLLVLLGTRYPILAVLLVTSMGPFFYSQLRARAQAFSVLLDCSPQYRRIRYLVELLLGGQAAKEIRTFGSAPFFLAKYELTADELCRTTDTLRRYDALIAVGWGSVGAACIGLSYLYLIHEALARHVTVGDVVMFGSAIVYSGVALRGLVNSTASLWTTMLNVDVYFRYISVARDTQAYYTASEGSMSRPEFEWVVDRVSFSYPGAAQKTLDNVTLHIRTNETIAIVGPNGAGKTTLVKIMLGLLKPDVGTVRFRGLDIRNWEPNAFRMNCGVIFQDPVRYNLSLFDNIAIALDSRMCNREAVLRAAAISGVTEIADRAPAGFDTLLGKEFNNGIELSGGEWQRIALARALVRDPAVLFLDEPSASLDPDSEKGLCDTILAFAVNRTTIMVSHRLAFAAQADRTIVLDQGTLVQSGAHNILARQPGLYARMYSTQSGMYWGSTQGQHNG
jgi:ATP-binding cassette subfamily B protein